MYAGRVAITSAQLTRLMIYGARQPLWRSPAELGLPSENLDFTARDGVRLRGWLMAQPHGAGGQSPAVVVVHGWPWNRCGNQGGSIPGPDSPVDLLEPAGALHRAGFHVLLFDLRNHGLSEARPPVTFGLREADDVAAAIEVLRGRADVDASRIGLLGYSMGANAALFAVGAGQPVRAAVLVQPVRAASFARNFAASMLGPAGPALLQLAEPLYRALGGPPLASIDPEVAAGRAGDTELLFIQGSGDTWGSLDEVRAMAQAAPRARPVVVATSDERFGGYQYVRDHASESVAFFRDAMR
jgi:pimeloyl-ACP methyl ester carboxylesterase